MQLLRISLKFKQKRSSALCCSRGGKFELKQVAGLSEIRTRKLGLSKNAISKLNKLGEVLIGKEGEIINKIFRK